MLVPPRAAGLDPSYLLLARTPRDEVKEAFELGLGDVRCRYAASAAAAEAARCRGSRFDEHPHDPHLPHEAATLQREVQRRSAEAFTLVTTSGPVGRAAATTWPCEAGSVACVREWLRCVCSRTPTRECSPFSILAAQPHTQGQLSFCEETRVDER